MKDSRLKELIAEIHSDSDGTYGAPGIHAKLTLKLKIPCSKKRVARLMCEVGLYMAGCNRRPEDDLMASTLETQVCHIRVYRSIL